MTDTEQPRKAGQRDPGGVGKAAEEAVKKYLEQTGQLKEDVRADRFYQWWDVDFVLKSGRTVEVKGDTYLHKTGNLMFEAQRDHEGAGCFYRSKADQWYYVDAETGDCYVFPLSEAQAWVATHEKTAECELINTRSHRRVGGVSRFVTYRCYRVNLEAFKAGVRVEVLKLGVG